MVLFTSLQRSLSLWWTCVDVQRGWLWDESVYRRSRHCLCPSLWRITSSTSESVGPHLETHTRTPRGSLRHYYSATIRPQRENVYIVAHWWNLKLVFFVCLFFHFYFPLYELFKLLMALEEARGTVWRRARAAAAQQTCSASRCTPRPGEYDRKHINLGMPLKAHSNNRSSFPGCKACRAQSSDTGDRGGRRSGSAASRVEIPHTWASAEETNPGRYLRIGPPGDGYMTDSNHCPFFVWDGCVFPRTHMRVRTKTTNNHMDFTSFCSLWAWVTFLSDFIVSVRFQLMMMILSRCLAIF